MLLVGHLVGQLQRRQLGREKNLVGVGVFDFALVHECFTGPDGGPPSEECLAADLDGDGDVDFQDIGALQVAFSD